MEPTDISFKNRLENVTTIPCFRKSLLYGITGGIGSGLLRFLFTSNVKKSTHFGFGSYVGITAAMWMYCRFTTSAKELQNRQFKAGMEKFILTEGTENQIDIMKDGKIKLDEA